MADFKGKRVLVTAGASGIGHAMAEAFSARGAKVWVTDIDQAALNSVDPQWRSSQTDASSEADMTELFSEISKEWGGLDVLCANAGVAGPTALIEDVTLEEVIRDLFVKGKTGNF